MADEKPSATMKYFERLISERVIDPMEGIAVAADAKVPATLTVTREIPVYAVDARSAASGEWVDTARKVGEQSLIYANPHAAPVAAPVASLDHRSFVKPSAAAANALAEAIETAYQKTGARPEELRVIRFEGLTVSILEAARAIAIPLHPASSGKAVLEAGRVYSIGEITAVIREIARRRFEMAAKTKDDGRSPKA